MQARGFARSLGIRGKLITLFLLFGALPAIAVFAIYFFSEGRFEKAFNTRIEQTAVLLNDTIDRNLFERYGDVQAFGLNQAAVDPANWRNPEPDNPLIRAMNGYMTGYGIYRLMLLVDTSGRVLAVNTVDAAGRPLDTKAFYDADFRDAPWFAKAVAGQFLTGEDGFSGTVVEQPARDAGIGALYGEDGYVIPFAAPVTDTGGRTIGIWVNFADFGLVEEIVASFYGDLAAANMARAEITLLDAEGRIIVDYDPRGQDWTEYRRNPDIIGTFNLAEKGVEAALAAVRGGTGSTVSLHARKQVMQAAGYSHSRGAYGYPGLDWSALVRIPVEEAYAAVIEVERFMTAAILVGLVMIAALGSFVGSLAAKPVRGMTAAMNQLAGGSTEVEIPAVGRSDEIGQMAGAVQVFKDNAIEVERLKREQEAQDRRAAEEKRRQMMQLADGFEASVRGVVDLVSSAATELQATSKDMSATAEQTSSQSATVASASEEATTNVQTVASAAEELSASIQEISRQISESNQIAQGAVTNAQDTNGEVQGLAEAAQKIGDVVNLIRDIAEQTNLLALNATIEAARAGDAGKGFAVVANEVKSLANQTAKATEEIAAQVEGMQSATQGTVQSIEEITKVIARISENATAIAGAIEEQNASTQEIARNVQQAAAGTQEVQGNIVQVQAAAEQTGHSAGQVLSAASELSEQSEKLRGEVDRFVAGLRAA